jgi:pyruvate-formate lyase-activating enzyme
MKNKPTCEDMLTAAEWLDVNGSQAKDGDNEDEMASCTKVAEWLRAKVEKADKKRLEETAVEEILLRLEGTGTTKQEARAKKFLSVCEQEQVRKLFLTGQTADGLQYKFLDELIDALQSRGFEVGVRTNGYLAKKKLTAIQKMQGEIGYSIHTIRPETNKLIMGRRDLPDWETIIPASGSNVRVAIVLNRYNVTEFDEIVKYIAKFPNVRYIQVRRISTDTRLALLQEDIALFEKFYTQFSATHEQTGRYYKAQQFEVEGKEVVFWRTIETSVNSLNYFTDGTVSDEYFIIEGYLKNLERPKCQ